jgi:hypothetical protein
MPRVSAKPEIREAEDEAGEIRRFTIADLSAWGDWLIDRISERYPGRDRRYWLGKLHEFSAGNDYCFIRNERAVLCIGSSPRALDGALVCLEIFAFSRDALPSPAAETKGLLLIPFDTPAERPLVLLYRSARAWCRSQRAARFFVGQCSDMSTLRIKGLLSPYSAACGWISVSV